MCRRTMPEKPTSRSESRTLLLCGDDYAGSVALLNRAARYLPVFRLGTVVRKPSGNPLVIHGV